MKVVLVLLLVLVAGMMAGAAAAFKVFGPLGLAVVLVLTVLGLLLLKKIGGRLFQRLLTMPFRAKGAVLRHAIAEVHGVYHAPAPAADPEDDEDDQDDQDDQDEIDDRPREWFYLDVTIRPGERDPNARFSLWEPGELMVVGPEAEPEAIEDDEEHRVAGVEVWQDGAFRVDEQGKYEGIQRLRMHLGLPPADRHAIQFRYYFELFGAGQLVVRESA